MSYRYAKVGALVASAALFLGLASTALVAQTKTLTRKYDPIVFEAYKSSAAMFGLPVAELTAYRYNAAADRFEVIPFQIDEKAPDGSYFTETDGMIDVNDEICFMPEDAGDRAGTDQWLNDAGAIGNARTELEIVDPLDPNKKAWVYVFRNVTNPPAAASYMSYIAAPQNTGADTIKGKSYVAANNAKNGMPNYGRIVQANGSLTPDLIDHLKLRINGTALGLLAYKATEDRNLNKARTRAGGGKVRVIREASVNLGFPELSTDSLTSFTFPFFFFPYSSLASFKNAKIKPDEASTFGANLLRQSFDFSDAVAGTNMKFYNAYNTGGVNVDGVPATVADKVDTGKVNWIINTGNLGTFISLVSVPGIGTQQRLYYYDNANGGTGEGTNLTSDTGDLKSFGDFGIRIDGRNISGQFSFDFNLFYLNALPGSDPVAVGAEFKGLQENPVVVTATQQGNTSAVNSPTIDPNSFALYEAYPNPFSPAKERVRLAFNTGAAKGAAVLLIYNLVGQEVARFTSRDAIRANGRQEIAWDGADRLGRVLPAGVYFYRLQAGNQIAVKKLVLVR